MRRMWALRNHLGRKLVPKPTELTSVVRDLAPELRRLGFNRFGTTFNREVDPGLVHVIGFQGSKSDGRFTANLGIYVREVDVLLHDWWGRSGKLGTPGRDAAVREEVCWLRARLGRAGVRGDAWWDYTAAPKATTDVAGLLGREGEAAFGETSSRAALVKWWRERSEMPVKWKIERPTPLGFALLLKDMGEVEEARAIVETVCREARGIPFFHMASVWAEELGFACPDGDPVGAPSS
jgi:Domain of unknown function (DUF4304)